MIENGVQVQQEVRISHAARASVDYYLLSNLLPVTSLRQGLTLDLVGGVMETKIGLADATSEIDQEIEREIDVIARGRGTVTIDAARGVAQGREIIG
jgi:hypothetical protein